MVRSKSDHGLNLFRFYRLLAGVKTMGETWFELDKFFLLNCFTCESHTAKMFLGGGGEGAELS
jgi:hypothetical protein